jgi:chromosome segregation ATPase
MAPTTKENVSTTPAGDPLDHLEERIQKAVSLVARLREEKDAVTKAAAAEKASLEKNIDALRVSLEEVRNANVAFANELDAMREEKQQVRTRLEILLEHIDQVAE